jgi:hypothetical protein
MKRFSLSTNAGRMLFALILMVGCMAFNVDPVAASAVGMVLSFETVAGSVLSVSTGVPATYDSAGYAALSWTAVGEITNIDGELGRQYNVVEHSPIATSQTIQKKGGYKLGSIDLVVAWDQADAGQDLCRTAADDPDDVLSVRIVKQSGAIRYFTAQVSKFTEKFGTSDSVNQGMVTLLRQRDVVMNPA